MPPNISIDNAQDDQFDLADEPCGLEDADQEQNYVYATEPAARRRNASRKMQMRTKVYDADRLTRQIVAIKNLHDSKMDGGGAS